MNINFPQDARWFNTSKPLSLHYDLSGQIVLMFFWTKNCIHCQHVLADLAHLRRRYQNQPLSFIGVHVDKYPASLPGLESAIERLGIPFPVLADTNRVLWNACQVTMWPTLALLGPDGNLIGVVSGEGHLKLLENAINRALSTATSAGTLAPAPLQLPSAAPAPALKTPLLFPTKILADKSKNRLAILDTGHHRILLTSWPDAAGNITLQQTIGSGSPGSNDGDLASASFNSPQGLAVSGRGDTLFVADTANHLVRRIDLAENRVLTILGTGQQLFDHEAGKSGREQGLNAPWDLLAHANRLYIAQAGQHQILAMNLMTLATEIAAGTSRLDLRDGPSDKANLAQPSALALVSHPAAQTLYFTDAQSSSLRALNLKTKTVTTLIGKGLFDFGDIDGPFATARLTHPLALSSIPNQLFLADTLNHKIKHADLLTRTITTLPIETPLNEPTGLALFPDSPTDLFIADTNHHRLLHHNLTTHQTRELTLHAKQSP